VIASHYAEPLLRHVAAGAALRSKPSDDANLLVQLVAGEPFAMLDESLGWSWGYAGGERRVGYVRSDMLADQ
jgi:hypothetical protein